MKRFLFCCLLLAACAAPAIEERQHPLPNVVLFVVDDLGWQDTSVPFTAEPTGYNQWHSTPALEMLAARGVRFSNAYSTSPVCTPTRTSILTGLHPAATHITDWTLYLDKDFSRPMSALQDPSWNKNGLTLNDSLLPRMLQRQGYYTMYIGKSHLGAIGTLAANPLAAGFDRNVAGHAAGGPGSYYGQENYGNNKPGPWGVPDLEYFHGSDVFLTEALTIRAEQELELAAQQQRPFFLQMAQYAVHSPIQPDPRFVEYFLNKGLDEKEAAYASLVAGVDASLMRILDKLEELDLADNTLIIFCSDNGGLSAHSRGRTPLGSSKDTHNQPLRSGKGSGYEGGLRVPLVMAWAGAEHPDYEMPAGALLPFATLSTDLYTTIADLAHIPQQWRNVGALEHATSLWPVILEEQATVARPLAWHYPHKWGPKGDRYEPFTAWREGDYKLIYWYESEQFELFNLSADIGESTDLIVSQPVVAQRLADNLQQWMRDVDAQRPLRKSDGEMLPLPTL
ncbi:MAG: arylsulfatase A-like enzyme [Myxococcota bacterium]|jgi:arylsulfatase A-like enzyme